MRIVQIFKTLINILKGPSKNYSKGMNSTVDALDELIIIGNKFISAPGSIILCHDASTIIHTGKTRVEKTIIGNNVFMGANSVVLPGIIVGNNVIIGAGAVVTKNIPDGMVVGGNPAKILCTVLEYINKCEMKNSLYEITPAVLKKHGTGVRATEKETKELIDKVYLEYASRND
jgi:NDP-sugar pyrophosphorylase family protein